jgi:hypothetical protein
MMDETARRMLALMDRAVTESHRPVIGKMDAALFRG